ncbi:MAG: 4-alpha-glucanotransferase [Bacteroidota bacterium]|nr:4-alpha-glucanotransferase [Candidatus Kapabacteria bacterium]MDW8219791.1 4-alpha-glucanotransferase [Bacteroidota bacterium]
MAFTHFQRLFSRSSGILAHITSLPCRFGIGDMGPSAYQFVDFLHAARQRLWQVLPLTPTGYGNSPYYSYSAMAGNFLLISPDMLKQQGYLSDDDIASIPSFPDQRVDFARVIPYKMSLLEKAFTHFTQRASSTDKAEFERFCAENSSWLPDFALFVALKNGKYHGEPWNTWSKADRMREPNAMNAARKQYAHLIELHTFLQYEFRKQWKALRSYANSKGIALVGDIPIFVAYDSADVWSRKKEFRLDANGLPTHVAGVPPDYFSATGQLWGNPHYNWEHMEHDNFSWWSNRFHQCFELYDIVRIDHFRGFQAFWEVPYGMPNAMKGKWVLAPGRKLFQTMKERFGDLPVIAEDLGLITPEVTALRKEFGMPGMKILQFGYESGDPTDPFLPHNYEPDCVTYTGTHDNDTTLGWFRSCTHERKRNVLEYLRASNEHEVVWEMIRAAYFSTAMYAIIPLQDILCLDTEHRMNFPGKADGNWEYRLLPHQLEETHASTLAKLARLSNRLEPVEKQPITLESTL